MSEAEERRREIMKQMKLQKKYNGSIPAIDPRYRATYDSIYASGNQERMSGFTYRFLVSILIFALFVAVDQNEEKILTVDSTQIVNEIEHDYDIKQMKDITCIFK